MHPLEQSKWIGIFGRVTKNDPYSFFAHCLYLKNRKLCSFWLKNVQRAGESSESMEVLDPISLASRCGCFWVMFSYNNPVTWSSSELPSKLKCLRSGFRSIFNDYTAGPRVTALFNVISLQYGWNAVGTYSCLKQLSLTGSSQYSSTQVPSVAPPSDPAPAQAPTSYGSLCSSYQEALGQHRQRLTWACTRAPPSRPRTNVSTGRLHTETG